MIITGISWIVMTIAFWALGFWCRKIIDLLFHFEVNSLSGIILMGVVSSVVYAETVSVFYRLGKAAFLLLAIVSALSYMLFYKSMCGYWKRIFAKITMNKVQKFCAAAVALTCLGFALYLASMEPSGYDTYNYHVPSIRWLEEFGVVKGLGNLHTRFAYNSSFLCLQALFSFTWIYKSSLHSMNGFLWLLFVLYCVFGFRFIKRKGICLSDLLRVIFLALLFRYEELQTVSSPNTDFMPMCLVAFVFIQWCALNEKNEKSYVPYGLLCVLALFNMSVKLSAAALLVFTCKPLYDMIRKRKAADICKFVLLGLLSILPYLVRNVIISGYLLYPVASLDLFDFDWEMPKSVVISDNVMIKVFARAWGSGYGYSDLELPFWKWFLIWMQKSEKYFDIIGLVDLALAVIAIAWIIFVCIKKKSFRYDSIVLFASAFGYIFLVATAPAARFGRWWFLALPVIFIFWIYTCGISVQTEERRNIGGRKLILYSIIWIGIICSGYVSLSVRTIGIRNSVSLLIEPKSYANAGSTHAYTLIDNQVFYYYKPNTDGQNGLNAYDGFPGTECLDTLNRIDMRGESLKDGFRVREEYKNVPYDFQGVILDSETLKIIGASKYYPVSENEAE